jgi:hypothetical protein
VLSTNKWSSLRLGLNKTDGLLYAIKTYSKAYMDLLNHDGFGTYFISRLSDENKYTVKYYNSWMEGNNFIIVVRTYAVPGYNLHHLCVARILPHLTSRHQK